MMVVDTAARRGTRNCRCASPPLGARSRQGNDTEGRMAAPHSARSTQRQTGRRTVCARLKVPADCRDLAVARRPAITATFIAPRNCGPTRSCACSRRPMHCAVRSASSSCCRPVPLTSTVGWGGRKGPTRHRIGCVVRSQPCRPCRPAKLPGVAAIRRRSRSAFMPPGRGRSKQSTDREEKQREQDGRRERKEIVAAAPANRDVPAGVAPVILAEVVGSAGRG